MSQADGAVQYKYEDTRLGYIGGGVGDVVSMPTGMDVDGSGMALVLKKMRVLATREDELSTTGYADSGRIPGPFQLEVVGVRPGGGVTVLLDAGPGISGESDPLNGLASDGNGIYLYSYSRTPSGGDEAFARIRHYSGKRRVLKFDSGLMSRQNMDGMYAKYSKSLSRLLNKRAAKAASVQVIPASALAVRVSGLKGWEGAENDVVIGPDRDGREYQEGICVGVDDAASLYLLMTKRGEEDEYAVRRTQDLVIIARDGTRPDPLELKPWRDDIWSSAGENIRVMANGTIIQLWSQGNQFSLRRWIMQR